MSDPVRDVGRLRAIARLRMRDPEVRVLLDALARRAATLFEAPMGLVSVVLDEAQWFAGRHGLSGWLERVEGTPIEWSFCASVVREKRPLLIADASHDPRFCDNPLVTEDGVRFYLGTPLTTADGFILGSLCVLDHVPRDADTSQLEQLGKLASEAVSALESRVPGRGSVPPSS